MCISAYAKKQTTAQKKSTPFASSVLDASSQSESLQRKADLANNAAQRADATRPNNTGMPDNLKAGIESLSGFSMDDVRVHYNSNKPATVQALAYTQGTDIHVAPGQEKCLPHEAWHVAQQMAGRVSPTTNINGMPVNDNAALEHEADVMGEKAVQCKSLPNDESKRTCCETGLVQRVSGEIGRNAALQRKGEKPISKEDAYNVDVKNYIETINNNFKTLLDDPLDASPIDTFGGTKVLLDKIKDVAQSKENVKKYKTLSKNVIRLQKSLLNYYLLYDKVRNSSAEIYNDKIKPELKKRFPSDNSGLQKKYLKAILQDISNGKEYDFSKSKICINIQKYSLEGKRSSEKNTSDSLKTEVNSAFNACVDHLIKEVVSYDEKHSSFIVNEYSLSGVLDQKMILYGVNQSKTIRDYVNAQIECYPNDFNMQFSILILGCAREIAYLLGDPAAENRIARLLTKTIESKVKNAKTEASESEKKQIFDFNQVGALARTNPLLMYLNGEINSQDASHLILVRGMRYFGKIGEKDENEQKKCFEQMFDILAVKCFSELDAMEKTESLLISDQKNFSPATLGMFGLLRRDEKNIRTDMGKITFEKAKKGFKNPNVKPTTDYTPAWLEKANKHKLKLLNETGTIDSTQNKDFLKDLSSIKEKLDKAPITIRLHSSDLTYQKEGFYHAKPWFNSMEIGGEKISYHPGSGRDGADHYSLWRTYKDNLFRGKLWKKGKDVETQSIAEGAIQQNFGALNYGFESNCYGLIGGYDYGNVSLVLKKDSIKSCCLYTLGDKGVSYPDIDSLALALASSTKDKLLKGAGKGKRDDIRDDIINNKNREAEHLEVQIFKDVKFAEDVEKIVCVAVTNKEYEQLCRMVGNDKSKVTRY